MNPLRAIGRWHGPPLAWQILGLLVGGLVVAQLVTLLLTMVLPPAPAAEYRLSDIAAALHGDAQAAGRARALQRTWQKGPPDVSGIGWLVSDRSRSDLAGLLGADPRDVSLAFYTPLPFAGASAPERRAPGARMGLAVPGSAWLPASYVTLVDAPPPGAGGGGMPGPGFPGGGSVPGGMGMLGGPTGDGGRRGGGWGGRDRAPFARPDPAGAGAGTGAVPGDGQRLNTAPATAPAGVREGGRAAPDGAAQGRAGPVAPMIGAPAGPRDPGAAGTRRGERGFVPGIVAGAGSFFPGAALPDAPPVARTLDPVPMPDGAEAVPVPTAPVETSRPAPARSSGDVPLDPATRAPALPQVPFADIPGQERYDAPTSVPIVPTERALFGLVPAPFVQGDFVAAWRQADGRWLVVQPAPEPFPNAWQRRLMLWFAVAFAIAGPLGWLFARRLVKPLSGFATAAEQLGRDPSAAVLPLRGPAEIGRAANAFNVMQSRLHAFVDDRTAMVGAISHDLRTPLTRMRFRIEEVDDEQIRAGMIEEVAEMEAMITSVLDYIRDASTPNVRERLDLKLLVDDVVDDALMVGKAVRVERAETAPVEVDVLGMRRVLDNLLENAVKYGERARVRLLTDAGDAVAEIIDDGPGLPDEELERVFEPFYRTEQARASAKQGSGLGLAVCRSIARAHGGDVRLVRSAEGFLAQVRVPLAYGERQAA